MKFHIRINREKANDRDKLERQLKMYMDRLIKRYSIEFEKITFQIIYDGTDFLENKKSVIINFE